MACFGRAELIKKIVDLTEGLTSVALVGSGGIGKTSVARAALHDDRIKERFGNNRRFIRCDQFPASCADFLARLSGAIGAGIDNPQDLTSLWPSLSSREMFIVLDKAESILDPWGANGREIYLLVEELSEFNSICLAITSRITVLPPNFETLEIPTLPMEAAFDTFYDIHKYVGWSESVNDILKQLDFHPLSVTLLATVAHQNKWDNNRLVREWEEHQTGLLQTEHKTSLATAIEHSLASPMFRELGPHGRGLLEVVAFYPQGIDEKNIDWLFYPITPNGTRVFDRFCVLSLTYRSNGFITMLTPLRDHLRPKNPKTSPLLFMTKERYFARMSVELNPRLPGFEGGRWISSEDANVVHLLDVFTTVDPNSENIWNTCISFMDHLWLHKPRQMVLRGKIEGLRRLPDNHRFKPRCLFSLAMLSRELGNRTGAVQFLNHALKLCREQEDNYLAARVLRNLSSASQSLGHYKEGIRQAREASQIYERLGETLQHAWCLNYLGRWLEKGGQLDAAEEAVIKSISLLPQKGQEYLVCRSHYVLGDIYRSRGERWQATCQYEVALEIATTFNWPHFLFGVHSSLANIFLDQDEVDDAQAHIEQAKSRALDNPYNFGRAVLLKAWIWYRQNRLHDAASGALRAQEIFKQLRILEELEVYQALLRLIEEPT